MTMITNSSSVPGDPLESTCRHASFQTTKTITFAQGLQAGRQARPIIPSTGSVILIEALLQIVGGDKLIIP
ncbi:hypothetical protein, partial [Escherichia coli]|uniref:hypothetical protein n=1 Tax=Escherichia coli TaxID=562 RepID=UPI00195194AE